MSAEPAVEQRRFQELVTKVLVSHEVSLAESKQAIEVDFLVYNEELKQTINDVWSGGHDGDKRVLVLQLLADRFVQDQVPGGKRLQALSTAHWKESILRFRTRFNSPKDGFAWKFSLTPALSQTAAFRDALGDLVASGGCEQVKIRRPQTFVGPAVAELCEVVLGKSAKGKGKGGKGKGKNNGGKGNGDQDKGKGKGKNPVSNRKPGVRAVSPTGGAAASVSGRSVGLTAKEKENVPAAVPAFQPPAGSPGQSSAPSYSALAANDEAGQLAGELANAGKQTRPADSGTEVTPPPFKKSNSPEPQRTDNDARMSDAIA